MDVFCFCWCLTAICFSLPLIPVLRPKQNKPTVTSRKEFKQIIIDLYTKLKAGMWKNKHSTRKEISVLLKEQSVMGHVLHPQFQVLSTLRWISGRVAKFDSCFLAQSCCCRGHLWTASLPIKKADKHQYLPTSQKLKLQTPHSAWG